MVLPEASGPAACDGARQRSPSSRRYSNEAIHRRHARSAKCLRTTMNGTHEEGVI
jgi:hypothetical protein